MSVEVAVAGEVEVAGERVVEAGIAAETRKWVCRIGPKLGPRWSQVTQEQSQGWGMGFGVATGDFWGLA